MKRGEIYWVNLDPVKGSEQAGRRPAIIYQDNRLIPATLTVLVIPLTTNTKLTRLPTAAFIPAGEAGLTQDSVALCHQLRALDKAGFDRLIGDLPPARLAEVDRTVLRVLGIPWPKL